MSIERAEFVRIIADKMGDRGGDALRSHVRIAREDDAKRGAQVGKDECYIVRMMGFGPDAEEKCDLFVGFVVERRKVEDVVAMDCPHEILSFTGGRPRKLLRLAAQGANRLRRKLIASICDEVHGFDPTRTFPKSVVLEGQMP